LCWNTMGTWVLMNTARDERFGADDGGPRSVSTRQADRQLLGLIPSKYPSTGRSSEQRIMVLTQVGIE
jgi:hypothetical protein